MAKATADVEAVADTDVFTDDVPVLIKSDTKPKGQQTRKKREKNKKHSLVVVPPPPPLHCQEVGVELAHR